jgi:LacI family transcriptional regulator
MDERQHQQRGDGRYRVRVVVDGATEAGRRYLRGTMRFARTHTRWSLLVEAEPARRKGSDWDHDEACVYASHDRELLERILARGIPVVLCQAHHESFGLPTVRSDDYAIGELAAEYLVERGFSNLLFDAAGDSSLAASLRYEGFAAALGRRGINTFRHDTLSFQSAGDRLENLARTLLTIPKPAAVFFSHDALARGASDLLIGRGLLVPEQVVMLGVDNDELQCDICQPSLSSIAIPQFEIGHEAAATLARILDGTTPARAPTLTTFKPTGVVTRQSTDIIAFDEPRLAEALRFMREHACDPCSVDDVLNHVVISRRWLESQFRDRFKRSPHEEITRIRIERARYLLRDVNLPLRTVANRSGYAHVQNFVAIFRKVTGETPAAFRRKVSVGIRR